MYYLIASLMQAAVTNERVLFKTLEGLKNKKITIRQNTKGIYGLRLGLCRK